MVGIQYTDYRVTLYALKGDRKEDGKDSAEEGEGLNKRGGEGMGGRERKKKQ